MEIKKYKDYFGTVLELSENDITFKICFGGDLDLYWQINNINADDEIDYETFTITEENTFIYGLFLELYNSIANCEFDASVRNSFEYRKLFDGKTITWISDENGYKKESLVKISKVENKFVLEFARRLKEDAYNWPSENGLFAISIRFRNSGSSYQPFNRLFMRMYNALEDYEPDLAQFSPKDKTNSEQKHIQ